MILVTVGTHNHGFDRLVRAMDELAAELDEEVMIQWGSSTYQPQRARQFRFTSSQEMIELTQQARVIVTHAAAGAIITALRAGKPLVVVPRLKQFGEHMDDHQQQLAAALAARGQVVVVNTPTKDTLRAALEQTGRQPVEFDERTQLVAALSRQLDEWAA
jgi:beta-1,4-N-acetylglucosaminyltransferase